MATGAGGVAVGVDLSAARAFVVAYGVGRMVQTADQDDSISRRFGVIAPPAYAFVGAEGSINVVQTGL